MDHAAGIERGCKFGMAARGDSGFEQGKQRIAMGPPAGCSTGAA